MNRPSHEFFVTPAKAGAQEPSEEPVVLGSRFRGNDELFSGI